MSNYPPSDQPPGQPPYGGGGAQPPYGGGGAQPPYGGQPPGGGGYGQAQPKTSIMAIISLVTGILGLIPCCWGLFIFSIAAAILGFLGQKEIRESNGAKKGGGMAKAGLIMGIIGLVISLAYWILFAAGVFDNTFTYDMN